MVVPLNQTRQARCVQLVTTVHKGQLQPLGVHQAPCPTPRATRSSMTVTPAWLATTAMDCQRGPQVSDYWYISMDA